MTKYVTIRGSKEQKLKSFYIASSILRHFDISIPPETQNKSLVGEICRSPNLDALNKCKIETPSGEIWYRIQPHPCGPSELGYGGNDWHSVSATKQLQQNGYKAQSSTMDTSTTNIRIDTVVPNAVTTTKLSEPTQQISKRGNSKSSKKRWRKKDKQKAENEQLEKELENEGKWTSTPNKRKREKEEGQLSKKRTRVRAKPRKHKSKKDGILNTKRRFWRLCWKWKEFKTTIVPLQILKIIQKFSIAQRNRRAITLRNQLRVDNQSLPQVVKKTTLKPRKKLVKNRKAIASLRTCLKELNSKKLLGVSAVLLKKRKLPKCGACSQIGHTRRSKHCPKRVIQ